MRPVAKLACFTAATTVVLVIVLVVIGNMTDPTDPHSSASVAYGACAVAAGLSSFVCAVSCARWWNARLQHHPILTAGITVGAWAFATSWFVAMLAAFIAAFDPLWVPSLIAVVSSAAVVSVCGIWLGFSGPRRSS